ncbi:MAG: hypothetical protein RR501_12170 [Cloacibacillus sp.]
MSNNVAPVITKTATGINRRPSTRLSINHEHSNQQTTQKRAM